VGRDRGAHASRGDKRGDDVLKGEIPGAVIGMKGPAVEMMASRSRSDHGCKRRGADDTRCTHGSPDRTVARRSRADDADVALRASEADAWEAKDRSVVKRAADAGA
jgi:hypothetical protein